MKLGNSCISEKSRKVRDEHTKNYYGKCVYCGRKGKVTVTGFFHTFANAYHYSSPCCELCDLLNQFEIHKCLTEQNCEYFNFEKFRVLFASFIRKNKAKLFLLQKKNKPAGKK